jgi:hypothetical protein
MGEEVANADGEAGDGGKGEDSHARPACKRQTSEPLSPPGDT